MITVTITVATTKTTTVATTIATTVITTVATTVTNTVTTTVATTVATYLWCKIESFVSVNITQINNTQLAPTSQLGNIRFASLSCWFSICIVKGRNNGNIDQLFAVFDAMPFLKCATLLW